MKEKQTKAVFVNILLKSTIRQLKHKGPSQSPYKWHRHFIQVLKNPWWSLELKERAHIKQIVIFNRCDVEEYARRFNKFSILKSEDGLSWEEFYEKTNTNYVGGEFGEPLQIETDIIARYIKIVLNGTSFLHLSKVNIYGDYV